MVDEKFEKKQKKGSPFRCVLLLFGGSYGVHVVLNICLLLTVFGKDIRPPKGVGIELC